MQLGHLYIAETPARGRGVFSLRAFQVGEIIEVCPVIVLPAQDVPHLEKTHLYNYYFQWGDDEAQAAITLGYGSLYNHSYMPNAWYEMDFEAATITVICIAPIAAGDEITFNYNGDADDQTPIWFDVR